MRGSSGILWITCGGESPSVALAIWVVIYSGAMVHKYVDTEYLFLLGSCCIATKPSVFHMNDIGCDIKRDVICIAIYEIVGNILWI